MIEGRTWDLSPSVAKVSEQWTQRRRWSASWCCENVSNTRGDGWKGENLIHRTLCGEPFGTAGVRACKPVTGTAVLKIRMSTQSKYWG
jgi:hypothetical protein